MKKAPHKHIALIFSMIWLMVHVLALPAPAEASTTSEYHYTLSQPIAPTTEADLWLESSYAMLGSAAGNGALILSVTLLDILPSFFAESGQAPQDWLGTYTLLLPLLLALPIASTYLTLEFLFPKPEMIETHFLPPLLASTISTVVHALFMILFYNLFNQGSFSETFYLTAPAGFITAVLIEGLSTAFFYDGTRHWKIAGEAQGGLKLTHAWQF